MVKKGYSTRLRFIILATVFGNLLQWFDFSLFGIMLPLFMSIFFTNSSGSMFFVLFCVGAVARLVGGIIFGYMGDTQGRKTALVRTILFMTIPIFLVALLPTEKEIGVVSGIFLIILYLFQCVCVGGEFSGSMLFLTESSPSRLRGYIGIWAYFGVVLGMFLVAIDVYELNEILTLKQLKDWGWRIPFFMGALVGVIGIFMRHFLHETPIFSDAKQFGHLVKRPILDTIKKHKKALVQGIAVYLLDILGYNLVLIYSNFFFLEVHKFSLSEVYKINIFTLFISLLFFPIMGRFGNYIGNVRLAKWAAILIFIFACPMYFLISQNYLPLIYLGQGVVNVLIVSYACNMPMILYRIFPTEIRYTCTALVVNLTVAIFGGTSPLIVHIIITHYGLKIMPGFYLMIGAVVGFFTLRKMKDLVPQKR